MRALLIGAGGHGKVVLDAWQLAHPGLELEVRDDRPEVSVLLDCPVGHPAVPEMTRASDVHIAVGQNRCRQDIATRMTRLGPRLASVIHPAALVSGHATIGPGVFVAARAIVGPGAKVGAGTIVNHGAIVDHDCCVGDWAHIAPGAVLGGAVSVGHRVLVGAGAVILPGIQIADDAVIGAGAVVTKNVGERQYWIGVPARIIYG
jgi:sugar O-acyltransferase (sialic acid O-acetyltransferase NeuD family)